MHLSWNLFALAKRFISLNHIIPMLKHLLPSTSIDVILNIQVYKYEKGNYLNSTKLVLRQHHHEASFNSLHAVLSALANERLMYACKPEGTIKYMFYARDAALVHKRSFFHG